MSVILMSGVGESCSRPHTTEYVMSNAKKEHNHGESDDLLVV
jgi:hypothetical protein